MSARTCVVLVPVGHHVTFECDRSLRALEARGYPVVRLHGISAVDVARNELARRALAGGFDDLLWIDADTGFDPDDVERLRAHELPFVAGIYAKKNLREVAAKLLPETKQIVFGAKGGLVEVEGVGFGFALVRREVFDIVGADLPVCNEVFGKPMRPFFLPMVADDRGSAIYYGEDYAFCRRAREKGFRIVVDTRPRLWHFGEYPFGWEDTGSDKERFASYVLEIGPAKKDG